MPIYGIQFTVFVVISYLSTECTVDISFYKKDKIATLVSCVAENTILCSDVRVLYAGYVQIRYQYGMER